MIARIVGKDTETGIWTAVDEDEGEVLVTKTAFRAEEELKEGDFVVGELAEEEGEFFMVFERMATTQEIARRRFAGNHSYIHLFDDKKTKGSE